jgi:hypothetical protein
MSGMGIVWCLAGKEPWCLGWLAEKLFFPALIAVLVYKLAVRQLKKKREIDFAEKQLAEFYAPMLGARAAILNHTKFDNYLNSASYWEDWARRQERVGRKVSPETAREHKEYGKELDRFFAHINDRLLKERVGAYVSMRDLFASKMAYADSDTRAWYDYFYAFVEMWRELRANRKADPPDLSPEVVSRLGQMFSEQHLQPFYAHLSSRVDELQGEISGSVVAKTHVPVPPTVDPDRDFKEMLESLEHGPIREGPSAQGVT